MQLVLVGYGRMGHEIEAAARERTHAIAARVDPANEDADYRSVADAVAAGVINASTVVIDFSLPAGLLESVKHYGTAGAHAVIGTTGWESDREAILATAREAGIGLVWGANFSVGANMAVRIAAHAATLAGRAGEYDAGIVELHHRRKKDSPSGTAFMFAEAVRAALPQKSEIQTETLHRAPEAAELHVVSGRIGTIPGTHTLLLDSEADTVEVTHRARTRRGFAIGAVGAAEWIASRSGVFPVDAYFDALFGSESQ
jgi:4-hydroxy-tetrahydrodipicolinate reductase